jgi:putative sugar O-methyltransferase
MTEKTRRDTSAPTVEDDVGLLDLMLTDMESQEERWWQTGYWQGYSRRIRAELGRTGVGDFRSNFDLIKGYGAIQPMTGPVFPRDGFRGRTMNSLIRLPLVRRVIARFQRELEIMRSMARHHYRLVEDLATLALRQGAVAGPILNKVTDRLAGYNSGDRDRAGRYSKNFLHQAVLLSLLGQSVDLTKVQRVLEIGGGYGALADLFWQVRSGTDGYVIQVDIPPMAYITTQYLKALWPGKVIDYRDVRGMTTITESDVKGKILVVPPWALERLDLDFDLFWNSFSFQEMEKPTMTGYVDLVAKRAKHVFVASLTEGHPPGAHGQSEPIPFGWIADLITDHGFSRMPKDETTAEWTVFSMLLHGHDVGVFCAA